MADLIAPDADRLQVIHHIGRVFEGALLLMWAQWFAVIRDASAFDAVSPRLQDVNWLARYCRRIVNESAPLKWRVDKRLAILLVRLRNVHMPDFNHDRKALSTNPFLFCTIYSLQTPLSSTQLAMPALVRTVTTTFRHLLVGVDWLSWSVLAG